MNKRDWEFCAGVWLMCFGTGLLIGNITRALRAGKKA